MFKALLSLDVFEFSLQIQVLLFVVVPRLLESPHFSTVVHLLFPECSIFIQQLQIYFLDRVAFSVNQVNFLISFLLSLLRIAATSQITALLLLLLSAGSQTVARLSLPRAPPVSL